MAIISSTTIISSLALFHLTLAFFFLTSPSSISDQGVIFIIGESMDLPHSRTFDTQSAPLALLAVLLAFSGITDLVAVSQPVEISAYYWGSQAPVRVILFFILTFYSYAFSPKSPLFKNTRYTPSAWGGEGLKNRVVFAWAFIEFITWFWVYSTVREERREVALKIMQKRAREEEIM